MAAFIGTCVLGVWFAARAQNAPVPGCAVPGQALATVSVRVFDEHDRPVESLQAQDFLLTENGVSRKICDFRHVVDPVSVGILFDRSASMRFALGIPWRSSSAPGMTLARLSIEEFLAQSGPADEYFLEYISTEPAMECSFTNDVASLRAKLDSQPKGLTALIDGIYLALHGMAKARYANRALLLVSDGVNTKSVYSWKELEKSLSDMPVPIFLVAPGVWMGDERMPLSYRKPSLEPVLKLIRKSGGGAAMIRDEAEARLIASRWAYAIRSVYALSYMREPASNKREPARRLRITLKPQFRAKGSRWRVSPQGPWINPYGLFAAR